MQQVWNLKSRAHFCVRTGRKFEVGESFYTAIYLSPTQAGEFERRDVCQDAWAEELDERSPFSYWMSEYLPPAQNPAVKEEVVTKERPEDLLLRLILENEERTENARYILALMLERKKMLVPKGVQQTEEGRFLIYELKSSKEVILLRDPQLKLAELAMVQEEVAQLLGFKGAAE